MCTGRTSHIIIIIYNHFYLYDHRQYHHHKDYHHHRIYFLHVYRYRSIAYIEAKWDVKMGKFTDQNKVLHFSFIHLLILVHSCIHLLLHSLIQSAIYLFFHSLTHSSISIYIYIKLPNPLCAYYHFAFIIYNECLNFYESI